MNTLSKRKTKVSAKVSDCVAMSGGPPGDGHGSAGFSLETVQWI